MRRRDKAGGKRPRRRFKTSKRQNGLKARDRDETLEQLAATSEVLEAISRSTFDLQIVLATLVKSAGRLCQAEKVQIFLYDGEFYRIAADNGFSPKYRQYARDHPIRPGRDTLVARTALGIEPVQIPDALADPEYTYGGQKLGGYRTLLGVPLLRDEKCIGVIALTRSKVHSFTDRQVALVTNFAAQAVIAIENARLLNELRESLEQQTATSDVLRVISSSQGELEPVFEALLANAVRLCDAKFGTLWLSDEGAFRVAALHNAPAEYVEHRWREPMVRPGPQTAMGRMTGSQQPVQYDAAAGEAYRAGDALAVSIVELAHARTFLSVPMLKEKTVVGAINIYRQEVQAFTGKQVELVQNFAAQAVIAIENARLLNETKEALEQQRASAEVLNVISNSLSDAEPVFEKIVESCERIFATNRIGLNLIGPDGLVHAGAYGKFPGAENLRRENFPHPVAGSATGAAISAGSPIQYPDALSGPDVPQYGRRAAKILGLRAFLMAPLLSEGRGLGAIFVGRETIGSFSDKEVALLKTFAAQAVIAIENTRLLRELRQTTDQLKAQSYQLANLNQQLEERVADQIGEIERMSRLRRFLPPQVADLIVASGSEKQLESHRREITALFCDLRGFTGFSESSDPEDVMARNAIEALMQK